MTPGKMYICRRTHNPNYEKLFLVTSIEGEGSKHYEYTGMYKVNIIKFFVKDPDDYERFISHYSMSAREIEQLWFFVSPKESKDKKRVYFEQVE